MADVGLPIFDKQLVLQTLHGLLKAYNTVVNLISFQTPLPTFFRTRSLLQMEETRTFEPEPQPTTVLYTSQPQVSPTTYPSHGRGGPWRGRGRGGSRGRGRSVRGSPSQFYGYQHCNTYSWCPPPHANSPLPDAAHHFPMASHLYQAPPPPHPNAVSFSEFLHTQSSTF